MKNSVLKMQFIKGSGSCGEPTPMENQSSFNTDVLTYLIAPNGIVLSEEMVACLLTKPKATTYMALLV